ncbi:MAG: hypothetical protein COW73_00535 [Nitrospirae bacterium CG18_big_fil_WC_8_21_14_2_50_70_55]|nr:DUF971 domain-containing protein [Deltaproteobacteria bacterium]OIP66352.1 MAG: hypothetical protein AUK30_02620 [Nitrospirae bacterium CG2_30_70_394]PIQ07212.1 MAG: hypothetical protein COW73_00535 [Nitrospirae bacterium CG18_big_fil_WC_8_21_14_2_50_70_55]PIU78485.1 MAG: hypothetical protein COS73_07010 [Nitrospirae bacterium CG06_land_8_20_14_3_00_70_43]PIW83204.1 MAG: hypothetical protein COZ96_04595 [Nitrospirae bacterium CG_4_8_14_3_um_filter_70_85]PIX84404.1 MAG: hypothetical protein 
MELHDTPREVIHHQGDGGLEVAWADGHRSPYSAAELRIHCPCPECLTGGADRIRPAPAPGIRVDGVEPYGHYALALAFSDGHHDGIFRWDYLRYWCPCAACAERRARDNGIALPEPDFALTAAASSGGCACGSAATAHAAPHPLTLQPGARPQSITLQGVRR